MKKSQERVLVHVRMRPLNDDELKRDSLKPIEVFDPETSTITVKKDYEKKNFYYDTIFPPGCRQNDVFEKSSKYVVDSVLKGYNGTIFAYGQTGTGKTHTMVGSFKDEINGGVIPRSFDYMFRTINEDKEHKYSLSIAFIQIYLEIIQDLLEPGNENVRIREDPDEGVYLEGVEWVKVNTLQECSLVFEAGEKNRATASTKMNAHSSRSHAIMIVKVEKTNVNKNIENEDKTMTKSNLFLVDLAGSERVKKTRADAMRLEEAKKINFSLLVLGNCIQALSDSKGAHVNYRDSKLTRLLQESLGGNAKTSLIVTISPSFYNIDETISSLMFGQRAMKIQNKPTVNKTVDYQALSVKLQEDLDKLNDDYTKIKIEYEKVVEENGKLKSSETYLEMQRQSIFNGLDRLSRVEDSNENSMKDTTPSNFILESSNSQLEQLKKYYEEEIIKLERSYKEVEKNREEENEKFIQEIDKVLVEKENEIDRLKYEGVEIKKELKKMKNILSDNEKERDELQKSFEQINLEYDEFTKKYENDLRELEKLQKIFSIGKVERGNNTDNFNFNQSTMLISKRKKINLQPYDIRIIENLIQSLENEVTEKMKEIEDLIVEKKNIEFAKKGIEVEFESAKNLIKNLKKEKEELINDNNSKKIQINNYMKEIKIKEDSIVENESHFHKIEEKNENLIKENKLMALKITEIEEEQMSLKEKINEYQNEIDKQKKEIKEKKDSLNQKTKELEILKKDNNLEILSLNEKLDQLNNENRTFTEQNQNQNDIINQNKEQLSDLQEKLTKLNKDYDDLFEKNKQLQIELTDKENKINDLQNKQTELQSIYDKESSEHEKCLSELKINQEDLTNNLQFFKGEVNLKEEIIKSLNNNINFTQEKLSQSNEKLEQQTKILVQLNEEIDKGKKEKNNFIEKIQDLNKNIDKLSNELRILKESESNMKEKEQEIINKKHNQLEEKENLIENLQKDIIILKESNFKKIKTIDELENSIKSKDIELKNNEITLSNLLKEIKIYNENRELTNSKLNSFFVESSSYIAFNDSKINDKVEIFEQLRQIFKSIQELLQKGSLDFTEISDLPNEKIMKKFADSVSMVKTTKLTFIDIEKFHRKEKKIHLNPNQVLTTENFIENLSKILCKSNKLEESFAYIFEVIAETITEFDNIIKQIYNKKKHQLLELELSKKNEDYLKNALLALNEKMNDGYIKLNLELTENEIEKFIKNAENIDPQKLYKLTFHTIEDFIKKINSLIESKEEEIIQTNEKVIFYLKEIDLIKSSGKKENVTSNNEQVFKLTQILKLKEEEINRLNKKIEDQLITIKNYKNEENQGSDQKNVLDNGFIYDRKEGFSIGKKLNLYEEEINSLREQINQQETILKSDKNELKLNYDKFKKKDIDTGKFLIKEYLSKTNNFMEEMMRILNSKDDKFFN